MKLLLWCIGLFFHDHIRWLFYVLSTFGNIHLKPTDIAKLNKSCQMYSVISPTILKQNHNIVQTGGFSAALVAPLLTPVNAPITKLALGGLLGGIFETMAKVMHSVDRKMLQQIMPANPVHHTIATLDQDRVLLSDEDKVRQCIQILQWYLEFHEVCKPRLCLLLEMMHQTIQSQKTITSSLISANIKQKLFCRGSSFTLTRVVMSVDNWFTMEKSTQEEAWSTWWMVSCNNRKLFIDTQEFHHALHQGKVSKDLVGNCKRLYWVHKK